MSRVTYTIHDETWMAARFPFRVDDHGVLIAFDIATREDVDDPARVSVQALEKQRLRIFLSKYFIICWIYASTERGDLTPDSSCL